MCYSTQSFTTDTVRFRQHPANVVDLAISLVRAGKRQNSVGLERCRELRGVAGRLQGRLTLPETFNKGSLGHSSTHIRVQRSTPRFEVLLLL